MKQQRQITRRLRTVAIALMVIVAGLGVAQAAGAASGPTVDQSPVEYQALESEDHHVEVVFEDPIDPSDYAFTVIDADGTEVADDDDVNKGLRFNHDRQVTLDLGDHDLADGAVLRIEGQGINATLPITTTDAFVQEGYAHEPEIEPGETLAVVDIWGADQYYEIADDDGTVLASGTLGEHSFVAAVDTSGWDDGASYTVQFGPNSTTRTITTSALIEPSSSGDGDESLPPHVLRRTNTWFTDFEPDLSGTTVKFNYGPTTGSIVFDDANFSGTTSTEIDQWHSTPPSIPDPADPDDVVSMLDVTVYTTSDSPPTMTVRLPVLMSGVDGSAEDLVVRYYDGDEWVTLETSIVDRTDFYGDEMVTIEATAPEPGPVAIVVGDG